MKMILNVWSNTAEPCDTELRVWLWKMDGSPKKPKVVKSMKIVFVCS